MKKTLKVLGLLAVAAALFVGCKQNVEEPGKKDIQGEFLEVSEVVNVDGKKMKTYPG